MRKRIPGVMVTLSLLLGGAAIGHAQTVECTQGKDHLYLRILKWPADGVVVAPMRGWAKRVYMKGDHSKLLLQQATDQGLRITLPDKPTNPPVVVISPDGKPDLLEKLAPAPDGLLPGLDGGYVLPATEAELIGALRLERKGDGEENMGFWSDTGAYAEWPVIFQKPAEYDVVVNYSCDRSCQGSQVALIADKQELGFKVPATANWDTFKDMPIGRLKIEKSGKVMVQLKAKTLPGGAVGNFRHIELRPVKP